MDKKIINKVLENTSTEQEAVEVAQWLGEAEGQLTISDMIDADMEKMVPRFDAFAYVKRMRDEHKVSVWWRVAAIAMLVLTLGAMVEVMMPRIKVVPEQTVCSDRGEQMHVLLQDGTHIYLNAESRLVFPRVFSSKKRVVSLVGEAYFEVEKDKHHPFLVDLNGASVEVLGTQFNVSAYENEPLRVNLDEGHVVFHGANQTTDMQPGEQLVYNRQTCQTTLYRNVDTHMASAWKEHRLEVSEMPMQELEILLERRYDVKINVRDEQCYQYTYSLAASDHNLRTILKRMAYVSPILYHYDEEKGYVHIRARQ